MTHPVAAVQLVSGADIAANLAACRRQLEAAAGAGARLVVLPENFAVFGGDTRGCGQRELDAHGPVRAWLAEQASGLGLWIVAGTLPTVTLPGGGTLQDGRVRAACFVYDDQGREVVRYDKIHLFDVDVADSHGNYRESDTFAPGDQVVVVPTPFGRLGLAVCYDIRFPELFRCLFQRGVDLIAVPAAFTRVTGDAHWQALLRARAIENQVYVIGANQGGTHGGRRETSGGSCIFDPWGDRLANVVLGEGIALAHCDPARQAEVRARMPVAAHQRFFVAE